MSPIVTQAQTSISAMQAPMAIEAVDLVKAFGSNRAVNGVSLSVKAGTVYGLLGPNGAGKTTTVRMLATLLRPDAGTARIFGYDVVRDATRVRRLIGVTGQYASVDETLTAAENLTLFGRLLGLSRREARATAERLLEQFGLTEARNRPIKHFSGGMRRRLDLAASLIAKPPLIFLDEPTTGLDPRTRAQMWDTIRELVRDGTTVLLTTQYLDEADQLAERIAVIDHGRVIAEGTPDDLKSSVGQSSLYLTFARPADVARARALVEAVLGVQATPSPEGQRLVAPISDMGRIPELLVAMKTAGIDISELVVQKPTLDEVFLALTGHGAEPSGEGANA
ncbi:ATP-binding cassette domain-containing protein [Alicyclobacillus vulcanalis]|uniref:ABC-2 type transport system ATP-binding protein n=1 Tax=Alicyclobacillus vulcanalis TaxID=252246 RepID=A0A1N7MBS6_9BACL|nr:ATP-binding cassette domain-containing protein [Alicyclobacillus vulcanalis]SIS83507.1 ABC-2 type transport system ATP-binding protein [Alicyclobacillus vulcanalis]